MAGVVGRMGLPEKDTEPTTLPTRGGLGAVCRA